MKQTNTTALFICTRCGPVSVMYQTGWTSNGSPACQCVDCASAVILGEAFKITDTNNIGKAK